MHFRVGDRYKVMTANTSKHTAKKMQAFASIMQWHLRITDAARGKWYQKGWMFHKDYIYIDLYAGPGRYEFDKHFRVLVNGRSNHRLAVVREI